MRCLTPTTRDWSGGHAKVDYLSLSDADARVEFPVRLQTLTNSGRHPVRAVGDRVYCHVGSGFAEGVPLGPNAWLAGTATRVTELEVELECSFAST
jgi:hypothetical protein